MLDRGAIMTTLIVALFAAAQTASNLPPSSAGNNETSYLASEKISSLVIGTSPTLAVDRAYDGLFHVTALIDGQPVDMAIDTGATRTVLAQSDAKRIGLVGRSSHYSNMQTMSGRVRLQRVVLNDLKIGDRQISNVDIAVGPPHLDQSVVGLDVLSQSGPILIEADRLTLLGGEARRP